MNRPSRRSAEERPVGHRASEVGPRASRHGSAAVKNKKGAPSSSPRWTSPVRPRSPPTSSSRRREPGAALPSAPKPRSFSPRPLLDELFGFGSDPYDEKFLDRGPPTTIFAATHFSQNQPPQPPSTERQSSPSRRRSRAEMGYYIPAVAPSTSRGSHHTVTTIPVTSSESSAGGEHEPAPRRRSRHRNHRHPRRRHEPQSRRPRSTSADSRRSSRRAKSFDTAEDAVRGCVRSGFSLTRQFTSCLMSTADIYEDECKPSVSSFRSGMGDGGRLSPRNPKDSGIKLRTSSNNSVEYDDEDDDEENDTDDTDTAFTGTKSGGPSVGPSVGANEEYPVDETPSKPQSRAVTPHSADAGRASPQRPASQASFHRPETPAARDATENGSQSGALHRSDTRALEESFAKQEAPMPASPTHVSEQGVETTVNENNAVLSTPTLREVRMNLFHQDSLGALSQDQSLQVPSDVDAGHAEREPMRPNVVQPPDLSDLRQHAETASTEKLVLERLQLEEKLRHEVQRNETLMGRVSEAEGRNADLMNALTSEKLKNAKLVVAKRSGNGATSGSTGDGGLLSPSATMDAEEVVTSPAASVFGASSAVGTDASNAFISTVLVSLKADLVQARAELAEAHAARLSAEHAQSDLAEKLQAKDVATTALKSLITDLERQKEELQCRAGNTMDSHKLQTRRLEAQLSELKCTLMESTDKMNALAAEKGQLDRDVLESKGEVGRLREELESLKKELEETRHEHDKRVQRDEEIVRRLRDEVNSLNEKLLHSSSMVMSQAADHVKERRRFDEELAEARRASLTSKARAKSGEGCELDPSGPDGDAKSATSTATASTTVSGFRKLLTRSVTQDVADLLQRSKSLQSN